LKQFLRERILKPITSQLSQGADPRQLSLAVTLGALMGTIPILGISTGIGIAVASALKLNHAVFQGINYLVYPLQLILFPVFLKTGGALLGGEIMDFNLDLLKAEFQASVPNFLSKYGVIGLKAVVVWAACALIIGPLLHLFFKTLFKKISLNRRQPS